MKENNRILRELIENSSAFQNNSFEKNSENIREQIMLNRELIEPFETWNKSAEFDKILLNELKHQQEKLIKFFNKNWNFNNKFEKLLDFNNVYESQTEIGIEWHANSAIPHIYKYLIQFEKNGFFKLKIGYPNFYEESILELKSLKTNYRNLYQLNEGGKISMKSKYFELEGNIIGEGIIDKKINLRDYKDRERFTDPKMLTIVKRKNVT
ncbi:hypothetical protein BXQ17_07970 [Polaribacter sp. BM10]|uniref:hypothetical protein n=1 Tax=Polaribacter sp. BM10 TaxID=1529069 RepID=UPI00098BC1F1|nr:hypothetical protein [Polaribacter sp. BM10]AQS94002.1 hypothetical protein BXQ17_07970 [Polaribacter sp. BM10]